MIHIVTSNPVAVKSLKDYNDNFIICHLQEKMLLPFANATMGFYFKVYHQDGMILDDFDEYEIGNSLWLQLEQAGSCKAQ